jgi:hypothetical protein
VKSADMHFHNKGRTNAGHRERQHKPSDRPPSTAWLAAQEAFAAPRPAASNASVVVVRRASAPDLIEVAHAHVGAPTAAVPIRPARVFRVISGPTVGTAPKPADCSAGTAPAPLDTPPPKRNRRANPERRPGPVKLIVNASVPTLRGLDAPPARGEFYGEQVDALRAMMTSLDGIFTDIMAARRLRFES